VNSASAGLFSHGPKIPPGWGRLIARLSATSMSISLT